MSEEKLNEIVLRDESFGEASLKSVKNFYDVFSSLLPTPLQLVGAAIGISIDRNIAAMQENRIREYCDAIKQYLVILPEEIFKSEELAEAVRISYSHYVSEASKEKRKLLLDLYKSYFDLLSTGKGNPYPIFLIFDSLFMQLSLPSLLALMQFRDNFKGKAAKGHILDFFRDTQEIHYMRCFSELVSQGLLEDEIEVMQPPFSRKPPKVIDDDNRMFQISPLGAVFLAWLKHDLDT